MRSIRWSTYRDRELHLEPTMPSWSPYENMGGTGAPRSKSHRMTHRWAPSTKRWPAMWLERPSTSSIRPSRLWRARCSWRFALDLLPVLGRRPRLRGAAGGPDADDG